MKRPAPRRAPKPKDQDGLTARERLFALEYMADTNLNATQAAIRAGLSARSAHAAGHRLLQNPRVRAFVDGRLRAAAQRLELSIQRLEQELAVVAFIDPARAYDAEGRLLPVQEMPEDVRRAIAGFEEEALFDQVEVPDDDGTKKVRLQVGVVRKVKWLPKVEAIALGLKRLGALVDRSEVKVQTAAEDLTDEEWELLARARHEVIPNREKQTTRRTGETP